MLVDDVALEDADGFEPESNVEAIRIVIERRDADEYVGTLAKNPLLRPRDDARADASAAGIGGDANRLDVAGERSGHVEDQEAGALTVGTDDVALFGGFGERRPAGVVIAAQGQPRLVGRHRARTPVEILRRPDRLNRQIHSNVPEFHEHHDLRRVQAA